MTTSNHKAFTSASNCQHHHQLHCQSLSLEPLHHCWVVNMSIDAALLCFNTVDVIICFSCPNIHGKLWGKLEGEGNHSISVSAHWFMQKNTPALHQLVGLGSQNRFLQSLYVSLFSARQHLFSTELKLRKKKLFSFSKTQHVFSTPASFQYLSTVCTMNPYWVQFALLKKK